MGQQDKHCEQSANNQTGLEGSAQGFIREERCAQCRDTMYGVLCRLAFLSILLFPDHLDFLLHNHLPTCVGTRGDVGRLRGPCACPGCFSRSPRRTSTRPPLIRSAAPCPYDKSTNRSLSFEGGQAQGPHSSAPAPLVPTTNPPVAP